MPFITTIPNIGNGSGGFLSARCVPSTQWFWDQGVAFKVPDPGFGVLPVNAVILSVDFRVRHRIDSTGSIDCGDGPHGQSQAGMPFIRTIIKQTAAPYAVAGCPTTDQNFISQYNDPSGYLWTRVNSPNPSIMEIPLVLPGGFVGCGNGAASTPIQNTFITATNNPNTGLPWTRSELFLFDLSWDCIQALWVYDDDPNFGTAHYHTGGFEIYDLTVTIHWDIGGPIILGSISVNKLTDPSGSPQSFAFTGGGGLVPANFNLADGGSQIFSNLGAGVYSIVETPIPGWTTQYVVSNGDPNTAININANDVVVNVTNAQDEPPPPPPNANSGIYKLVPGKRQDTLWEAGFVSTFDVKIP